MSKISIYEFQSSRKRNVNKYRQYCKDLIANEAADELLKYAACIFRSDINDRFEEELQLLIKATKGLSFFQEMNSKIKNVEKRLHLQCCQRMTYKFFRKGEIIFKQGDKADKAYIILDGSVNVYCFLEHHILSDLCSKSKKKFHALPQHARKLHPISIVNQARREKVKNKMALPLHLLRKIGGRPSVHKTEEYVQQIQQTNQIIEDIREEEEKDKKMLEQMAQIGLEMTNGIPPGCIRDLEFCFSDGVFKHKFITEMGVGQMFGEIALLLGQPRSASIIAKQNVECAVLNQDDYKQLLRDVELDKIEQRIRFFQSYFFRDQPRFVVLRYCYNFKKIKLNRGSLIFEEGDKPTHIYLIKRGDIELQYRQAVDKQISEQALQELARSQEQILMIPKRDKIIDDIKFQFDRICITIPETQIIGDIEILMKLPERQCSAVVRSDHARLYQISISHFYRILSDQQQLKKQFLQVAKQKYELNQQIRENIFNFYQQQNDKQKINQQIYLINLKRQIEQEELIVTSDRQLTDTDRLMLSADKCIANTERVNSKIKTEEDPLLQTNSLRTLVTKIKRYVRHPHSKQVLRQKERDEELFREEMRNMEHYSNKIKSRQSSNNAKELNQKNLDSIKKSSSPRFQFPRFDSENNSPSRRAYLNFNKKDTVNIYMRSTKSTNVSVKQGEQMGNNSQIENRLSPPPNNTHIIDRLNQQNKMISSKHNLFRSKPSTEYLLNRYGYKEKDKSII